METNPQLIHDIAIAVGYVAFYVIIPVILIKTLTTKK